MQIYLEATFIGLQVTRLMSGTVLCDKYHAGHLGNWTMQVCCVHTDQWQSNVGIIVKKLFPYKWVDNWVPLYQPLEIYDEHTHMSTIIRYQKKLYINHIYTISWYHSIMAHLKRLLKYHTMTLSCFSISMTVWKKASRTKVNVYSL